MTSNGNDPKPKKPWIMNAFAMTAPGHLAPGLWRHPAQEPQTLDHWVRLARFLDENHFHGIFFADVLGLYDIYQGGAPALQSGAQIPILDVSLIVSALAHATTHLCFGITASTTYENPYALARKFATLDHVTEGRIGWNIVTSYLESAAKSFGLRQPVEHDQRYEVADEFMEVVYKLLEGSWHDAAVYADKRLGMYTEPAMVHKINHEGKYFRCAGPAIVDPSPQRTPFLLQAGASKTGKAFASKHAEAMFLPGMIPEKTLRIVVETRELLQNTGRPPDSIIFIAGMFVCVDETDAKAQAKFEELLGYADLEGTAALFGGWTGVDLSAWDDDEDFSFSKDKSPAIQSLIDAWSATVPGTAGAKWTKRRVLQELAVSGAHPRAVGSGKTVADVMEMWVREAGVDGFNLSYAICPGTFEDMVRWLWPELKRRGVLVDRFEGGSMRECYLRDGKGPRAREGHPAKAFRWEK